MAGEVSAQEGAINRAAGIVDSTRNELTQTIKSLESDLATIGSQWQGQGAASFQQLMARWQADSQKLFSALNEFEANLKSSQKSYDQHDDAAKSTMSKFAAQLGQG